MARWQPAPIIGGAYSDESKPWSVQDTVNYIPVRAERTGTRSVTKLRGAPGYYSFCDLGTSAPIRGMRNVEGRLLVVSGTSLFLVSVDGTAHYIGKIPGTSRVSMSHNQITGGNQVAIANGQSGYVYNTVDGTLVQITDDAFIGSLSFDFVDGYITGVEPGRRFAFHSDLADALSYSSLDRYEAEGSPDRLIGQIVTHREWWLVGERTIEPYINDGQATGTFQRQSGVVMERGAASPHCLSLIDNTVMWLGDDGIVYRANGYTPMRVSTYPIEADISECNLSQCFSMVFEDQGHKIYYLTFPDGRTWGYDVSSGEWHRRESKGLNRWRINAMAYWNGAWVAGDYSNGKVYRLDWCVQSEDGEEMERRRVTGVLSDNQNRVIVNGIELVIDTGLSQSKQAKFSQPVKISGNLPDGLVGDVVSYQYAISGGLPPLSATIVGGSLPNGLSMTSAGLVSGTTSLAGSFSWRVGVTSADGYYAELSDSAVMQDDIKSAILADSPILYYPLHETSGSTATDLSGNARNGSIGGSVTQSTSGLTLNVLASGVTYPGSSSGSPLDVGCLNYWAIECVFTRNGTGGSNYESLAIQWRSPNLGLYNAGLGIQSGKLTGGMNDMATAVVQSTSSVANGVRTHAVVVRNGSTMSLYVNGSIVASTPVTSVNNPSNGATFAIGGTNQGSNFPNSYGFLGKVEHVTVYDHALMSSRVLYHAQLLGLA